MRKIKIIGVFLAVLVLTGCSHEEAGTNEVLKNIQDTASKEVNKSNNASGEKNMSTQKNTLGDNSELVEKYSGAVIKTSLGDITVKFYGDKTPVTVGSFLNLAQTGFYDGIKFHRVIKGFMIQGGDPNSKTANTSSWGTGGPGYRFDDELTGQEKYPQGTLAMANAGPDTNGSQFFIVTASPEAPLPPSYTVFGEVTSGMEIALKIENVKTLPGDRPIEDVVIKGVELLEK